MAEATVPKTLGDAIDAFDLQMTCAESLTWVMEDVNDDYIPECPLAIGHPEHQVMRMYAVIKSLQSQLRDIKTTVHEIPSLVATP